MSAKKLQISFISHKSKCSKHAFAEQNGLHKTKVVNKILLTGCYTQNAHSRTVVSRRIATNNLLIRPQHLSDTSQIPKMVNNTE